MTEDNRIPEIRAALDEMADVSADGQTHREEDYGAGAVKHRAYARGISYAINRIEAILDSAPPAPRVLGPEHTYALSVARSAVLKAAGKFVTAADMYRKRDLLHSVQEMADIERACVRVASFLADEIASARASEERAIPEPTEGTQA